MRNHIEPTVYLCGGLNGLTDEECNNWRTFAKSRLLKTIDPMRRDYRGRESTNASEIVHGDLQDIQACTCVLANCAKPSWGTAMEIFYAHSIGKPVYAVVPSGPVSPWLEFHAYVLHSLGDAITRIRAWQW